MSPSEPVSWHTSVQQPYASLAETRHEGIEMHQGGIHPHTFPLSLVVLDNPVKLLDADLFAQALSGILSRRVGTLGCRAPAFLPLESLLLLLRPTG